MEDIKYALSFSINTKNSEKLKQMISDTPIENKENILKFLKSAPLSAYTSAPAIDVFTGEQFKYVNNAHSDGVYQWYENTIYHFEKYNLKLNDDFIAHVLNRL